jgi:cytochrome b
MMRAFERETPMPTSTVRAWDWPTRAFHWSLVLAIISAWVSFEFAEKLGDASLKWHRYNGYFILTLIVFRLIWGVVGSSTSRWSAFVTWPWTAAAYGLDLVRGRDRHFLGHNPLGTYMILGLLALVSIQGLLGLMTVEHNDTTWGPLYKLVSEENQKRVLYWHTRIFNWFILPLVSLHIIANSLYGIVKKDPLVRAMITGRKPSGTYEHQHEAQLVSGLAVRAALSFALAAAIVLGGIVALGGKLFY